MTKMLKVTISGSYLTSTGEIIDFEELTGVIPFVDEDKAAQYVRKRYASMWIKVAEKPNGEKLFPKRLEKTRQVFIDDIEETKGKLSFAGKDIKKMLHDELQDLATAKDLNNIHLPKGLSGTSLREMREKAYLTYSANILKDHINPNKEGYNFSKLPAIVVDANIRRDRVEKITNEEIIEREQETVSTEAPETMLTIEDLKAMAKEKNIPFHPNIGKEALHSKLFGGIS